MESDRLNNEFYNEHLESFDKIPFEDVLIPLILKYFTKKNSNVLEIGSGAGALASWMTTQGYKVSCIEPAEKPAARARSKGLDVSVTRFQDYPITRKFDAIIAISSLIHIPRADIPLQIHRLSQLIDPNGVCIASFIEGNSEGYEDPTSKGKNRFFSKFEFSELKDLLEPYFSIVESHRIHVKKMGQSFLLMVLKAK